MTPVQSQPIGQYALAGPNLSAAANVAAPAAGTAGGTTFSQTARPSMDSVQTGWCERPPLPNPIAGGANPNPPEGTQTPQPISPSGSTGNSFLDLISQLMSQLDSVIKGLGGGATASPLQPAPGTITAQPDPGTNVMRQLLATGEVT